ncbi:Os08g0232100 [Oryza sativa Japonica Group]|jgi:hypothetical protein|uniref:Os08g0232100 protein n=1 Tax=Oryza sativa subsp. japonica TaxID=39947 RepID=A0A0P0XDC0_ORYSJ|nr:hypothetical protein EE612_042924 [Oryza sativa]BAT04436.1 Os08g0232100 [Oryza sativa Japonica Group]
MHETIAYVLSMPCLCSSFSKTGEVSAFLFQPQNSEMKDIQIDRLCKNKLDGFYCFGANLSAIVSRSSSIIMCESYIL